MSHNGSQEKAIHPRDLSTPDILARDNLVVPSWITTKLALVLFSVGIVAAITAVLMHIFGDEHHRFWFSGLTAGMFTLALALGSLFFVMIQFVTKAGWSVVVRRIPEVFMGNIRVVLLMLIPILFLGIPHLYSHWADTHHAAQDLILKGKIVFLNSGFFIIRWGFYVFAWIYISRFIYKRSVMQDGSGDKAITSRLEKYLTVFIFIYAATQTFAAFDAMMSLEPHWYSTIFGVYYFATSAVGSLALIGLSFALLHFLGIGRKTITVEHFHDVGKLLFGFNIFWNYIAFSQFFLIWYGNIPEETMWYHMRITPDWKMYTTFLAIGHLPIPLFYFLSRVVKRNIVASTFMYLWMLFMTYVDINWLIMPSFTKESGVPWSYTFMDFTCLVAFTGVFFGVVLYNLGKVNLIPVRDPRLRESLLFQNM